MLGSAGYLSISFLGLSDSSPLLMVVVSTTFAEGDGGANCSVATGVLEIGAAVAGAGGSVSGMVALGSALSSKTGLGSGVTASVGVSVL